MQEAENPNKFIKNADVQRDILRILDKAETTDITNDEHCTLLAYMAATIMFQNSQRPGVIEDMTIEEFQCRKDKDNNAVIIRVMKHKTVASTGPA